MKTASKVKSFLKTKGFAEKVKVRKIGNPFGGNDKFQIMLVEKPPLNASIASDSSHSRPTHFYSDTEEGRVFVAKLNEINRICEGVGAFAVIRFCN